MSGFPNTQSFDLTYCGKTSDENFPKPLNVPSVQKETLDLREIHQEARQLWPPVG